MPEKPRLDPSFYDRSPLLVARDLIGQRLVRMVDGQRIAGYITETEAYDGEEDLACHARAGRTPRTQVMYGPPGHVYVYFTYGMHWLLNFVTGPGSHPSAVLIRSIFPVEGLEIIAQRRGSQPPISWTNGPAKICRALDIDGRMNGQSLTDPASALWVESEPQVPDEWIKQTPRVGISNVPEPWRSKPWRYVLVSPNSRF